MKRVCMIILVITFLCAPLVGCAANSEKKQLFVNGFHEILSDGGGFKPPEGVNWGAELGEVAEFLGLEFTVGNWTIMNGRLQDDGTYKPAFTMPAMIAKTYDTATAFGRDVSSEFHFGKDGLFYCKYEFYFDSDDVADAIDFAKSLERNAVEALGDSNLNIEPIATDIAMPGDLWEKRYGYAQWNYSDEDEVSQFFDITLRTDDNGRTAEKMEEIKANLVPEDIIVEIRIRNNCP